MPLSIIENWAAYQNTGIRLQDLKASDDRRFYFHYSCRQHYTYRTVKNMSSKQHGVKCPVCSTKKRSHAEEYMLTVLQSQFPNRMFLIEDRLLRGSFGATDFHIVAAHLAIELDGEQHFDKAHISGSTEEQQDIDRDKDAEYHKQGFNLLRVHHADLFALPDLLKACLAKYRENPGKQFHMYSMRHPCTNRDWVRTDKKLEALRP